MSKEKKKKNPKRVAAAKERWKDKEYRAKVKAAVNKPEVRKLRSEKAKKKWEDREYRKMMLKMLIERSKDPNLKKETSERMLKLWNTPEFREKMKNRRRQWTEEQKEELAEKMRKKWTEEKKKDLSEFIKQYFKDHPEVIEVMRRKKLGVKKSKEHCLKLSEGQKKRWSDPKTRAKQSKMLTGRVFGNIHKLRLKVAARKRGCDSDPGNKFKEEYLKSAEEDLELALEKERMKNEQE